MEQIINKMSNNLGKKEALYSSSSFPQDISDPRFEKVKSVFRKFPGKRLLDIGCFDGTFTYSLKEFFDELYGVDILEKAVKLAKNKGIKVFQIDVEEENLPFEDNFFDRVFCGETIEELYNPDHLLDEIYRILKPGGDCRYNNSQFSKLCKSPCSPFWISTLSDKHRFKIQYRKIFI